MKLLEFFKFSKKDNNTSSKKMFFDFNFKLAVIESLLDKSPSFIDKIKEQEVRLIELYDMGGNKDKNQYELYARQAKKLFKDIVFTKEDLKKVDKIVFDGGLSVYQLILPESHSDDNTFYIYSVEGIEYLKNLKSVVYISMINRALLNDIRKMGIDVV